MPQKNRHAYKLSWLFKVSWQAFLLLSWSGLLPEHHYSFLPLFALAMNRSHLWLDCFYHPRHLALSRFPDFLLVLLLTLPEGQNYHQQPTYNTHHNLMKLIILKIFDCYITYLYVLQFALFLGNAQLHIVPIAAKRSVFAGVPRFTYSCAAQLGNRSVD